MSKKNRYKFRNKHSNNQQQQVQQSSGSVLTGSPAQSGGTAAARSDGAFNQHAAEYRIIRNDMIRLVILNGIMLIAVFALYYANRSSGFVQNLYARLF